MKRITSIFSLLLCSSLIFISCHDNFDEEQNDQYLYTETEYKHSSGYLSDCECSFGDYGDAQYLTRVSGVIVKKYDLLLVKYYDNNASSVRLLDPCNLPRKYKEGQKIRFSGIEKIPSPYVRLFAPVIRLTRIRKR